MKAIFIDLCLGTLKCMKKRRFTDFAMPAFPYRHSLKIFPSQSMILLPSLKSFIPSSFLNPRIYASDPLQTLKSSIFQGFYSRGFVDFDIKELQSRSRRPDPAVPNVPLPFRHWSSAISQGEGLLHGWQFTALFWQVCASITQLGPNGAIAVSLPDSSAMYEIRRQRCRLLLALRFEIKITYNEVRRQAAM